MTRAVLPGILFLALLWGPAGAFAAEVPVRLNAFFEGGVLTKKVTSFKEMRQRQMVPQTRDFSCGAASLATIMRYYYGQQMSELEAILGMFKYGNQKKIRQRGFSLLDMKRYANALKYKADGFEVPEVDLLKTLKIPVIVLIETNQYKHFVVIRRTDDSFVYISDPSWGNRKIALDEFQKIWSEKVVFAIQGRKVGTPEGLYVESPSSAKLVSQMFRRDPALYSRFAMDPTNAMQFVTNSPLFIVPFIPGQ